MGTTWCNAPCANQHGVLFAMHCDWQAFWIPQHLEIFQNLPTVQSLWQSGPTAAVGPRCCPQQQISLPSGQVQTIAPIRLWTIQSSLAVSHFPSALTFVPQLRSRLAAPGPDSASRLRFPARRLPRIQKTCHKASPYTHVLSESKTHRS